MTKQKLSNEAIHKALADLPGWELQDGKLHKQYKFDTFAQALGWMVAAGIQADKMDHHPEWTNVYNKVTVSLVTHDLDNAISNLDVELAQKMDALSSL
ncbi:MAG: 4a-hydroxytetrahydrobiopterin dehydratase [Ardenticatenaceae bacterium]|nr:4a-hydroxytetrahydrobiopterin dehydratase [Ardenticatenaceae bacterium]